MPREEKTLCFLCRGQRRGEIGCASRLLEFDRRTREKGDEGPSNEYRP